MVAGEGAEQRVECHTQQGVFGSEERMDGLREFPEKGEKMWTWKRSTETKGPIFCCSQCPITDTKRQSNKRHFETDLLCFKPSRD